MKRSELIRLIQKEIQSITQADILYDSFDFSRNLLDKLEAAGMLPPEIKGLRLEAVDPFTINKWEKE